MSNGFWYYKHFHYSDGYIEFITRAFKTYLMTLIPCILWHDIFKFLVISVSTKQFYHSKSWMKFEVEVLS